MRSIWRNNRGTSGTGDKPATAVADLAPAREWGRLRLREMDDLPAPILESEPAGYEKALQLYFQRLGRVEEGAASVGEK